MQLQQAVPGMRSAPGFRRAKSVGAFGRSAGKLVWLGFAAAVSLGTATPAAAALVVNPNGTLTVTGSTPGGSATINFGGQTDAGTVAGLTSALTLTFNGIVNGAYQFTYSLLNTSSGNTTGSRVSGFALNTNPTISGGSVTGAFTLFNLGGNYPVGFGPVGACVANSSGSGNGNDCSGPGGAVEGGAAATGLLNLTFSTLPSSITLSNFAVRYQSIVASGIRDGSGIGDPVSGVPELATWALMLLGFGGIGIAMRRSRRSDLLPQMA